MNLNMRTVGISVLILVQFSSWFTIGVYALFLQLYAFYNLGATNFMVSLFSTVYFAVNAPMSFLGGYVLDKYGKPKLLLLIATLLLALSALSTPIVPISSQLLIIRGVQGMSIAIIIPLVNLFSARILGTGRGVGIINVVRALGFMSGSLIGGFLADYISYIFLFYVSGVLTLISFASVLITSEDIYPKVGSYKFKLAHIRKIAPSIWIIYLAFYLRQHAAGGIWSLFSLFLFSLGATNLIVGLASTINNLTQALLFKKISEISEGRGLKTFRLGLILSVIVFLGYYLSENVIMIMPIQIVLGLSWIALYSGANVYIIENTPKNLQGTALGLLNMFIACAWITGSLMNGYITDLTGNYKEYILLAVFIAFVGYLIVEFYHHYTEYKMRKTDKDNI